MAIVATIAIGLSTELTGQRLRPRDVDALPARCAAVSSVEDECARSGALKASLGDIREDDSARQLRDAGLMSAPLLFAVGEAC